MYSIDKQVRRMAGVAAIVASLVSVGGTLSLAEHYAQAGGSGAEQVAAAPAGSRHAQSEPATASL